LHRALDDAAAGTLTFTPQDEAGATYAHKIVAADRYLNFAVSSRALHDRVRALSPHIGAFTMVGDERLGLWRTALIDGASVAGSAMAASPSGARAAAEPAAMSAPDELAVTVWQQPGVVAHTAKRLVIGTVDGAVEVLELQPAGKRRMAASDWLRGLREPLASAVTPPPTETVSPAATEYAGHPNGCGRSLTMAIRTVQNAKSKKRPGKVTPARWVAYNTIRRTFDDEAYTDRAFAAELERCKPPLDARDRAHAQALAYGVVQRAKTLDHVIAIVGKRPLRKIDGAVLHALRLGMFELLMRENAAADAHAAV